MGTKKPENQEENGEQNRRKQIQTLADLEAVDEALKDRRDWIKPIKKAFSLYPDKAQEGILVDAVGRVEEALGLIDSYINNFDKEVKALKKLKK